jgi:hypothetical protein
VNGILPIGNAQQFGRGHSCRASPRSSLVW